MRKHRFAELDVPAATVEGLIVLKLYALPSLDQQMDLERIALYENDITMLLARHQPRTEPLLAMIKPYVMTTDMRELATVVVECSDRANRLRQRARSE